MATWREHSPFRISPEATSLAAAPMTPFWLTVWAVALSCTWLLPNHYMPWTAFHTDAWGAIVFLAAAVVVALRSSGPLVWHGSAVLVAVALCIPALQYWSGLLFFAGQMWIVTTYLLGLVLAMLVGQRWEQAKPGQLADGLFLAIGIASIVSVNLQLQTWLGLIDTGMFDIWSMGLSGARPYANLGQPNQLGTLLIWGLLACMWAFQTRRIGVWGAVLMAVFLLVGIALTQSRTAWLGLTFLAACSWWWRRLWRVRVLPWVVMGLFVFFWVCHPLLHMLRELLQLGAESEYFRQGPQGDLRFVAWRLLASAALEHPWLGYGWSSIARAQLEVAQDFPALAPTFGYSHNLFLDLVLWLGVPLGLFVSFALVAWFGKTTLQVKTAQNALLVMCLGVVGIHAMLEFPLAYAYFLLPAGAIAGALNNSSGGRTWATPRWTLFSIWLLAAALLGAVVRDYFRIESSFREVQFEVARIGTLPVGAPPDVWLLTQLSENINFMRYEVKEGMTTQELDALADIATAYPSGGRSYKVAKGLALNHQPEQASKWLRTVCKISTPDECALIQRIWLRDASASPLIAAVSWPEVN